MCTIKTAKAILRKWFNAEQLSFTQIHAVNSFLNSTEKTEAGNYADILIGVDAELSAIPALYAQENERDPMVHAHYFHRNGWNWYITEKNEGTAFGYIRGEFAELGYFSIPEITKAGAELDFHFTKMPLSQVKASLARKA